MQIPFTALFYTRMWGPSVKQMHTREEFLAEAAAKTDLHYAHLLDNANGTIELTIDKTIADPSTPGIYE